MPTHLDIVDAVARPFLPVDGTPPVCLAGRVQVFIPPVQAALWLSGGSCLLAALIGLAALPQVRRIP